jgi:hypothetical protein
MLALKNDNSAGILTITIPKNLLVPPFTVISDGHQLSLNKSETQSQTVLVFAKPSGSQVITVQGVLPTGSVSTQNQTLSNTPTTPGSPNNTLLITGIIAAVIVAVIAGVAAVRRKKPGNLI